MAKPNASVRALCGTQQRIILQRGAFCCWLLLIRAGVCVVVAPCAGQADGRISPRWKRAARWRAALGKSEIGILGRALDAMRTRLEGKEYVEQLMHTLTHELADPRRHPGMKPSLLQEDMPSEERARFLGNILEQNARQRQPTSLLALVRVEESSSASMRAGGDRGMAPLLAQVAQDAAASLAACGVLLEVQAIDAHVMARRRLAAAPGAGQPAGERHRLCATGQPHRPAGRRAAAGRASRSACATVAPGIPAYAQERVRALLLPRPHAGRAPAWACLSCARLALLHGSLVDVGNHAEGDAL